MKKTALLVLLCLFSQSILLSQPGIEFDKFFLDKTMRIDFYQTGNAEDCYFSIDQVYAYDQWAGNPDCLIDNLNYGMYYMHVYDPGSNRLLYSRGFATIFGEYGTTVPAKNGISKTFHQTALIPYPKNPVLFVILDRDGHNLLKPVFSQVIDPDDINIIRQEPASGDRIFDIYIQGNIHEKADLVFVAEGYTSAQVTKFTEDVLHFTDVLFGIEPFKSSRDLFNIRAVHRPSSESGVDEPDKGTFRNTVVSASYNALGLDRYLLIDDTKTLRDIAAAVPYDVIIVIANSPRYGGGGIYNDYTIFTADDSRSEGIFIHEFGHGFANLADEYYSSTVAYNDFFRPGREPHEPNITLLLDPDNVKWKHLLSPGIEIPTYWGQHESDSLHNLLLDAREKKHLLESQRDNNPAAGKINKQIQVLGEEISRLNQEIQQIKSFYTEKYKGKVGVFEGAGYSAHGIYRSGIEIGFNNDTTFNPVSSEAILRIIRHFTEQSSIHVICGLFFGKPLCQNFIPSLHHFQSLISCSTGN